MIPAPVAAAIRSNPPSFPWFSAWTYMSASGCCTNSCRNAANASGYALRHGSNELFVDTIPTRNWSGSRPIRSFASRVSVGVNTVVSMPCGAYNGEKPSASSCRFPNSDIAIGTDPVSAKWRVTSRGHGAWSIGTHPAMFISR